MMKVTIECDCGDTLEEGGREEGASAAESYRIWFRCYFCQTVTYVETRMEMDHVAKGR